ncbi:MAG: sugar transporter [Burkholderiales bacterium]|jgi:protein involved in polysaccharide export with SLBB domain|nr:sugar transporter [Burkholderiales bacterium]
MRKVFYILSMAVIGYALSMTIMGYAYSDGGLFSPQTQPNTDLRGQAQVPIVVRQSEYSSLGSGNASLSLDNQSAVANAASGNTPPAAKNDNSGSYTPDIFQNNVAIRSGLLLQNYGYSMFSRPTTFAPASDIPVDANYTLGPGDQVYIQGWGTINVNYTANVANDGTIFIPKVGKISLVGIKASSLDQYLKTKIGQTYRNFSVSATVSKVRSIQVYVTGFALSPGTYQLSALSTLTSAIFAVGGPDNTGSLRRIQVKRNGVVVTDFDMYDVLLRGDTSKDIRILPGDIIYFVPKGHQVAIYDGIKVPDIYEVKKGETVKDVIKFAGGYTFDNARDKVIIEELDQHQGLQVLTYKFDDGLKQQVTNGQIIHFFTSANRYQNSIVLVGNVAQPSRLQYTPGMKIKDVIPSKEALLTKSFWNSYSYNTAGVDNQKSLSGTEKTTGASSKLVTNDVNSSSRSGSNDAAPSVFSSGSNLITAGPIRIPDADINWNYATIVRIDQKDYSMHVIPFNLAKAIAGDAANNLALQPGDVISVLSSKDVRISQNYKPVFVFIDGEVASPGVYELKFGQTLPDLINIAGGLTNKAYLFGTELNRDSVRRKQMVVLNQMIDQMQQSLLFQASNATLNITTQTQTQIQSQVLQQQQSLLDKLRQVKPVGRVVLGLKSAKVTFADLPKVVLENSDTVYIPAMPTTVDVLGQAYNPATFMYKSNFTVGDYINMAGTENKFADTSSEFVLRADGSIYSKQQAGWFGRFASRSLNPGDSIIIPQDIQFGSGVQTLLNWTQILANFGIAAAAITVFKN